MTLGEIVERVSQLEAAMTHVLQTNFHTTKSLQLIIPAFQLMRDKGMFTDDELEQKHKSLAANHNNDEKNLPGDPVQSEDSRPDEGSSGHDGSTLLRIEGDGIDLRSTEDSKTPEELQNK